MTITKKVLGAVGASVLALAVAAPAFAEEDRKFGWFASMTIVSDYLFRGISFTNEDPTIQPYLEFTYGIAYVGFWASEIGDGPDGYGPWEVDYYAGIRPVTGPVNWDFGVLYYTYGNRSDGGNFNDAADYVEFQILASTTVDKFTLGGKAYYVPDQDAASPETYTIEGTLAYALPGFSVSGAEWVPTLSGGVGYTTHEDNDVYTGGGFGYFLGDTEYTYWNAGLKITVERFFMDFRYWDTDVDANPGLDNLADERFLFSAGVTFP